jgi:putative ABC transport system substrate-binding protein
MAQEKSIAIMWVGKSGMAKRVMSGFLARQKEQEPDLKVELEPEIESMSKAAKLYHGFESKMDGIVFLRSSGAEFLGTVSPKVPSFVGACNNPLYLGAVNSLSSPQGKITGVTYFIPYENRFRVIKSLFPEAKSVALLAQKGHPSTPIDQQGTKAQCGLLNMEYHEAVVSSPDELIKKAGELAPDVDLLIIGNQALIIDNTVSLLAVSNKSNTPIFSYADKAVKSGAVAGLSADDWKLGAMLADIVIAVVVNGRKVSQVPVKMDPEPKLLINKAMMGALGLNFPEEIMQKAEIIK